MRNHDIILCMIAFLSYTVAFIIRGNDDLFILFMIIGWLLTIFMFIILNEEYSNKFNN